MSSRREKKDKLDKLAEYKRARQGIKRTFKEEDTDLYDVVTDQEYHRIVKGRLERDDFVVDDGVEGYMDNGMDDWTGGNEDAPTSDEELPRQSRASKSKGKAVTQKKRKPKVPTPPPAKIDDYRPLPSHEQENALLADLFGAIDSMPAETRPRKRKASPIHDRSSSPIPYAHHDALSDTDDFGAPPPSDDTFLSPLKKPRVDDGSSSAAESVAHTPMSDFDSSEVSPDDSLDNLDMDSFMEVDDEIASPSKPQVSRPDIKPMKKEEVKKIPSRPAWLSVYDSLSVSTPETLGGVTSHAAAIKPGNISALEPDGSLRFFWLDYLEEQGKLYFTGKLKDKTSGLWVSCCITVQGLERNLFLLPWDFRQELDEEGNLLSTDEIPSADDLIEDFDVMCKASSIRAFKAKAVKRKYAFGEDEVPREEREWVKVTYSFEEPEMSPKAWSPNIKMIFGTNTSAFELLVLKRRIMGPCWLEIKNPQVEHKGISWCKFEATVNDPKDINPFPETDQNAPKEIPPLNIVSLATADIVNHSAGHREVVCVSARVWPNMNIDDPTPLEQLPCSVQTFVRPLGDSFPAGFEGLAKANGKGCISPVHHERSMLNSLLVTLQRVDPDVIVGHDFLGVSLDVLLHRMKELKAENWSRLGRFRRSRWPTISKQGYNLRFLSGRLLCDLASDGAKSMIASTTWSLTEMCKTHLLSEREEIAPEDTWTYFEPSIASAERLLTFVRHCELDAHYHMAIASKVQILPLTRQLTNLAGNAWNKTLNGGRAERNEYILLHEFHRLKYICPDKMKGFGKKNQEKSEDITQQGGKVTKAKRDKYKGGLVLEPKRGLHDKFILVMDFNSLYPSIIQEYNIDFTTVDPVDREDDEMRPLPLPSSEKGVLPRLIANLVNRRRQVKSLMKDKSASPAKILQYDIKQQALKLTANSMYGCLGFEYSRFYARPLAALTTLKGRQILTHTKELAEKLNLDVVYGDTDSVFVNSNATNLPDALKVSSEFKRAVNECYKLLEIDLDGVFQRLLLLQKKKYAALKVEDADRTSVEVKGLDMKRREYCSLSKKASQYVLDQILSGDATEDVVDKIHEYLVTLGQGIRAGSIPMDDFIIHKRLGKEPSQYPDAGSQPHVQVALRLKAEDRPIRAGDVISYIFCKAPGQESSKTGQADRARHPDELRKPDNTFTIDFEYYISNQLLPPIERLCDPIEGTDRTRLAECLGLDPERYKTSGAPQPIEDHAFSSLDSQLSDAERFKGAAPFFIRCRKCGLQTAFTPLNEDNATISSHNGPVCFDCKAPMSTPSLQIQLETQIRGFISKYYQHWAVCQDPVCGYRTRTALMGGHRCIRPNCQGELSYEYSDAELYTQLRYFARLFDSKKVIQSAPKGRQEATSEAVHQSFEFFTVMSDTVEKYLEFSARRYVELSDVFSFMKIGR